MSQSPSCQRPSDAASVVSSAQELATAPRWTPPFLTLPVHAVLEHQFSLGVRGVESTLVYGPKGVGKSTAVKRCIDRFGRQELERARTAAHPAAQVLFYESSLARGPKTVLVDLYLELIQREMGRRNKQDWTPTAYIKQIAEKAAERNVRLICIDEAQMISAENIDLLRQVPDRAQAIGHSVRLMLIGNEGLRNTVEATGQAGERFTGDVPFSPITPATVGPHLPEFHPGLAALRDALPPKEWKSLERELFACAGNSFRRLCTVIENAHELATRRSEPFSDLHVRFAIQKILPTAGR